ncbi:hypothetical protein [Jannaschia sp. CCS1]|uniref:hypothetical protein n=1 Tax=Jannaschia sp. (strain CCS1) TaxID=290400 RepID=UPI000053CF9B|nr:hypothetical protein [Jannaschia sp. CCS1]ABD56924.1 hypothetical protein Jann_4007 [Jannaschia sp. CCS1]
MKRILLSTALIAVTTLPVVGQVEPADDVQELIMVSGAAHVLRLASQCTSMFLRMNPIPTGGFDVTSADISEGQAVVALRTDAPFDWGQSEMTVTLYEEDDYASLDCTGTATLGEGSSDLVWNALHRHTLGVGALLWGTQVPPAPDVLRLDTCLEDFPHTHAVTSWEVQFSRPEAADTIAFTVFGNRQGWGDGCLELE